MQVLQVVTLFALIFGYNHAVPFFGDFMHHLTPQHRILQPIPLAPLETLEAQASHGYPQIWQQFVNNPLNPVYRNSEPDFITLEQQEQEARHDGPSGGDKPFDVDVVTSDINHSPGLFFQQSYPFFGHDIFNSFGGFGIGAGPHQEPWWKGPNVCTEKEEDEKVIGAKDNTENTENTEDTEDISTGASESLFGQFHFSLNSCVDKPNKYVCTKIVTENGKKKTFTITRQCCHGYGRSRNADFATPCEKIEIKGIEETAADMGAKEFIASAKSNGLADMFNNRKSVTIFMPIDSAFANYNENNMVSSKDKMEKLYLRHIVDGEVSLYDAINDRILKTQKEGQTIRINAYQMPQTLGAEPFRYTANCVPIEKHDKISEEGLVHTLGGVMKPVSNNVMDIIRQRSDMSIMRTVLETTKLSAMLEGEKPVTIFVPTDDAFEKLEPHLRRALKEGKGCASNILKNHILDLTFCSVASVAGAKTTAYNLLGEAMRFNRSKVAATDKSEVADLTGAAEQPVLINGIAKIIEADIMGTNGVLHVIDTILPTKAALPLSTLMQEKNVTIFKRLLEVAGLDDEFNDLDNATIFAPTDKALKDTKWAQLLSESPDSLKNNAELTGFLNYHVAQPMIKTCDLTEKLLDTAAGSKVRINLYSTHSFITSVMNRATVNCARLVHFDDESCGSVLHQVDKALAPPKMTLLELLASNPNYSKFLELVNSANLTDLLANVDEGYTVLVPKNDIFAEVADWERTLTKDQNELESLVKHHIVNDVVCCAGIIPTNWPFVRSVETLNGAHLRITRDRRPKIENAGVTKCDNIAVNGIIHEINDIIVPRRRQQQTRPQHHLLEQDGQDQLGGFFF